MISSGELLDRERVQSLLDAGDLRKLFIEELGWDNCRANITVSVGAREVTLDAIAQKRDLVAYECTAPHGKTILTFAERASIEAEAAKLVREHLIIFSSADRHRQIWQWAKREMGRPIQRREHAYLRGRRDDLLVQKLGRLTFSLEAEERGLTIIDVAGRVRAAFDVEPVTKKFYDGFSAQHDVFLDSISGIASEATRRWYASIMLNRLMFVYFVQKKGFLDGDPLFLQSKLRQSSESGANRFMADYLLPLFFDCLARPTADRPTDVVGRIGSVPFLNGGLFERHAIEIQNPHVSIPDEAFARLIAFFESFQWHLDARTAVEGNEISPDVLGYIFERYVNRAQMGAYYTKEDITEYMASLAIITRLFAMIACAGPEALDAVATTWGFLRTDPDRYIFAAVRHGVDLPAPEIPPDDDMLVRPDLMLEAETWSEMLRRRERYVSLRTKLEAGELRNAEDCFRENVDLRQLFQDALDRAEVPAFIQAAWDAATSMTILDPACGSGAFLFAAMNVLEPIYEACLEKMDVMLASIEHPDDALRIKNFRRVLAHADSHPSQQYFILKQIALRNLYGVDIMDEAVEICKLRLFLKLVAQIDSADHVEPLPDLDFNVKAGNSLVGFTSLARVEQAVTGGQERRFDFDNDYEALRSRADAAAHAYDEFRHAQSDDRIIGETQDDLKGELRSKLESLHKDLNGYLAGRFGVDSRKPKKFEEWRETHRPFHWLADFFGIMSGSRFDVIIGNPPYVVFPSNKVKYAVLADDYESLPCRNLYALMFERSLDLVGDDGIVSLIVQLSITASERVSTLQQLLLNRGPLYYASFPRRPQAVFEGVEMPVSIVTSCKGTPKKLNSTSVKRFYANERVHVMTTLSYVDHEAIRGGFRLGKLGEAIERSIFAKLSASGRTLEELRARSGRHVLYYQEACRYWVKVSLEEPNVMKNGVFEFPAHWRRLPLSTELNYHFTFCLMNSSLFYWYYSAFSDCEHINDSLVTGFPLPAEADLARFASLAAALDVDLRQSDRRKSINTNQGHVIVYDELSAAASKPLIDDIDRALAASYEFTREESEFVLSYDIKYRAPE